MQGCVSDLESKLAHACIQECVSGLVSVYVQALSDTAGVKENKDILLQVHVHNYGLQFTGNHNWIGHLLTTWDHHLGRPLKFVVHAIPIPALPE